MEIPIILGFDRNYVRPAFTTMQSVLNAAAPENFISFFVLIDDLDPAVQNVARKMFNTERSTVEFIHVKELVPDFSPHTHGHITAAGFYRLLIPRIFHFLEQALWLDADTQVLKDLAPLLRESKEHPLYAVREYGKQFLKRNPDPKKYKPSDRDYFNSGVMVFNLPAISREDSDRLIERSKFYYEQHDEEILNEVFCGRTGYISPRYNSAPNYNNLIRFCRPSIIDAYIKEVSSPAIWHYILGKPWQMPDPPSWASPYLELYREVSERMDQLALKELFG